MKPDLKYVSLASRNACEQVRVATTLIVLIPIMAAYILAMPMYFPENELAIVSKIIVGVLTFIIISGGYMILQEYPENIIHLQHYIREIAAGSMPPQVRLYKSEEADEVQSIQYDLNVILCQLHEKLNALEHQLAQEEILKRTIESQHALLVQAEQHRVMIQNLDAACHQLGQPATVLRTHHFLLQEQADNQVAKHQMEECVFAVESIVDILETLRKTSEYRTIPYVKNEPSCMA